jgi:glutathione S-transferase
MRFVDLESARDAQGLRLVVLRNVPSPWSQAAKAIVDFKAIDALGVWMQASDPAVSAWTGIPNAPVAMYDGEPARSGWAEILALAERLAPEPRLVPELLAERVEMHGLAHELVGQGGLMWNARLLMIDAGMQSDGAQGFALPVAHYLGARYGYTPGVGERARARVAQVFDALAQRLASGRARGGAYYYGAEPCALDIYSAATLDALLPLPHELCPMHPKLRSGFESQRELAGELTSPALIEHRDMMHERHMPLPMQL